MTAANHNEDTELSLKELLARVVEFLRYIRSQYKWLFGAIIIGVILGFLYTKISATREFSAEIKFLVDGGSKETASSNPLAALGLAAANAGPQGGSDIFEALDISYIMSSAPLLERTILSKMSYNGKEDYVINHFIRYKKLEKGLLGNSAYETTAFYSGSRDSLDEAQNVYVKAIIGDIAKDLKVSKDPGSSLILGTFKASDSQFPKYFLEKLIEETARLYSYTKTAKTQRDVDFLQQQADSVRRLMVQGIASSAVSSDADPNSIRPATVKVNFQTKQADNGVLQSTYQTLASSLVTTRIELGKQMPFIQIYERSLFPLAETTKSDVVLNMLKFGFGLFFLVLCIISIIFFTKAFNSYIKL